jgi:hypothetical protein
MTAHYDVEYAIQNRSDLRQKRFETDDPVACEQFLATALDKGYRIQQIQRDGVPIRGNQFDNMIRMAAGIMAQEHLRRSLHVNNIEAHYRFGCPA